MSNQREKVVVIGSGPAGWTAALYTARANLSPLVYEGAVPNTPGGQLMITSDVENFPGFPDGILGPELMDKFKAQAVRFGARVVSENIDRVDFSSRPFKLWAGETEIQAETVIISTGANAKLLGVDKEAELMATGGGVSACATCDGAFFKDQHVAVIGGGDSAMEEANFLTRFASKVTLVHRRDEFRASNIMVDRAKANPKIEWALFKQVDGYITEEAGFGALKKENLVGVRLKDTQTGALSEIPVTGLFIAIGHKPNTDLFVEQLTIKDNGYLQTQPGKAVTNIPGVFAAGDVQDDYYRQAITAAGSGCMAAIEAERFLEELGL